MNWLVYIGAGLFFMFLGIGGINTLMDIFYKPPSNYVDFEVKVSYESTKRFYSVTLYFALLLVWIWLCWKFIR